MTQKFKIIPRKLKVFHCNLDGINWGLVAAPSKKRAAELFGMSMHSFNNYASETGHKDSVELAIANPEIVFTKQMQDDLGWQMKEK